MSGYLSLPRIAIRGTVDLLYPRRCVGCGAFDCDLCAACEASISSTLDGARCPNCSAPWEGALNCPRCFSAESLDRMVAATDMEGVGRQLVHGLKYRGWTSLAPVVAARMAPLPERVSFDVALPVPLHWWRKRSRGFNQAELLLRELGWPRAEGRLRRVRRTETQVGMHLAERRSNVSDAFDYRGPSLTGLTVALVDDVITTGATANECERSTRAHDRREIGQAPRLDSGRERRARRRDRDHPGPAPGR